MSVLALVRHGQARPFEKNSDRLTELGERQARALGEYWVRRGRMWTQAWSGTLERQRRTAEIVAECYTEAGLEFPAMQASAAFNEYTVHIPEEELAEVQRLPEGERNRLFQQVIERAMSAWMRTDAFGAFHSRVAAGIQAVIEAAEAGSNIAVFTSGGPIGVSVQSVVKAPPEQAIEINWRVRNCSVTEFLFSGRRISLDGFNATGHLEGALESFR